MRTDRTPSPVRALPSHLAAACIFARTSHRTVPTLPPPSGVLAELALLRRTR